MYECPTPVRAGHHKLTETLRGRLLSLITRFLHPAGKGSSSARRKRRHQLSNSEYHLRLAELHRLIAAAVSPRDKVMLRLMVETGIRRSEVAALQAINLDRDKLLLTILRGKGNKQRFVPVTPELMAELRELVDDGTLFLFRSNRGGPLSIRQINRIVAAAGRKAGLQNPNPRQRGITCHLLRHSFARNWKDQGGSIETLSKILGHANQSLTWNLYGTEGLLDITRNYQKVAKKMFTASVKEKVDR